MIWVQCQIVMSRGHIRVFKDTRDKYMNSRDQFCEGKQPLVRLFYSGTFYSITESSLDG